MYFIRFWEEDIWIRKALLSLISFHVETVVLSTQSANIKESLIVRQLESLIEILIW